MDYTKVTMESEDGKTRVEVYPHTVERYERYHYKVIPKPPKSVAPVSAASSVATFKSRKESTNVKK